MELSADEPFRMWRFLTAIPVIAVVTISFWLALPIGISLALHGPSPSWLHPLGLVKGTVTYSKMLLPILAIPVSAYSLVLAGIYAQCGPPYQFPPAFKIAYLIMAIIYLICGLFFLFVPELMLIWLFGLLYAAVPAAGSAWACVRLYRATSRFDS